MKQWKLSLAYTNSDPDNHQLVTMGPTKDKH